MDVGIIAANEALARHCEGFGRDPADIRKSMLIFATIGPDEHQEGIVLQRFLDMMAPEGSGIEDDTIPEWIAAEVKPRLEAL